ncbi:hypothetical protein HY251_16920, partial [bacterium]|nr:hypothetical protein [bacterium]
MSEYENVKRTVKAMRLSRAQAKSVAEKAYEADLAAGLPHLALKCAREFGLGEPKVS